MGLCFSSLLFNLARNRFVNQYMDLLGFDL